MSETPTDADDDRHDQNGTPSEPRSDETGQTQATEPDEGDVTEGIDHDEGDDHPDADAGETDAGTHGTTEPVGPRSTAPQSGFTMRQVGIGLAVLAIGLLVAFAVPILTTVA